MGFHHSVFEGGRYPNERRGKKNQKAKKNLQHSSPFYPLGGIHVFLYRKNLRIDVLNRPFLLTVSFFIALWGLFLAVPKESPVQKIDREIEELEEMKRGYEAKALRHEDYAQRLQFENRSFLEARRHMELAQENRDKAAHIQQQIDLLQEKKKTLLKEGLSRLSPAITDPQSHFVGMENQSLRS